MKEKARGYASQGDESTQDKQETSTTSLLIFGEARMFFPN